MEFDVIGVPQVHFGEHGGIRGGVGGVGVWNTNSPYFAVGIVAFIVIALATVTSMR